MSQSPELTQFYNDLWKWIQAGTPMPNEFNFKPYIGICSSAYNRSFNLHLELGNQLRAELGNTAFPFNFPEQNYWEETNKYTNLGRLNWIKSHLTPKPTKQRIPVFNTFTDMQSACGTYSPTVAKINSIDGTFYACIGTLYGYIHTTSGEVRLWHSYSGARRFLNKYLEDQK